jgi:hypothetical protein
VSGFRLVGYAPGWAIGCVSGSLQSNADRALYHSRDPRPTTAAAFNFASVTLHLLARALLIAFLSRLPRSFSPATVTEGLGCAESRDQTSLIMTMRDKDARKVTSTAAGRLCHASGSDSHVATGLCCPRRSCPPPQSTLITTVAVTAYALSQSERTRPIRVPPAA